MKSLPLLKPIRTCVLTPNYTAKLARLFNVEPDILYRHFTSGNLELTGRPRVDLVRVKHFFGLRLSAQFGVN